MKYLVFIAASLVVLATTNANNATSPLSCYVCSSLHQENCATSLVDVQKALCYTLDFDDKKVVDSVPRHGQLATIFKRQSVTRATSPDVTFKCLKIKVTYENGTDELARSCVPIIPSYRSVCDFVKKELDSNITLKSCHECDNENCNGSTGVAAGVAVCFLGLLAALFAARH